MGICGVVMSIQKLEVQTANLDGYNSNLQRLLMSHSHFSALLKNHKIELRPLNPATEVVFKKLDERRQIDIVESYDKYKQMIIRAMEHQIDINNEVELLKFIVKDLRVNVCPEAMDKIKPNHIIEIYSLDFKQIYRSLNFLSFCGYDLFELLTHTFYELYERSVSINEYLVAACATLNERPHNYVESLSSIPTHLMREKFSGNRTHSLMRFKHLSLLRNLNGEPYGYIITMRIKQIKDNPALSSIHFI